ncbi:hypothetical protein PAHAL_9G329800 [Panicum hallii]|uniref:Uncharacterized protein n=1 Tax=Panicum hallii TaxID=206008 RepID=A0A2T8I391_9POAL|nr:hypothetical protein PAHAL_9G329800 [Panicum hallii]
MSDSPRPFAPKSEPPCAALLDSKRRRPYAAAPARLRLLAGPTRRCRRSAAAPPRHAAAPHTRVVCPHRPHHLTVAAPRRPYSACRRSSTAPSIATAPSHTRCHCCS